MKPDISIKGWAIPAEVKTLEVNDYLMSYLERGQGDPVVLVHGSLNDYRAWASQMEAFSSAYRTIAVSLRRFYPELWRGDGDDFSVRQHADDLATFIKKLTPGPVHLVGHSRGGDVVLILARQHPQLVQSIVLADPAPFDGMLPDTPGARTEAQKRKTFVTAALQRLQQGDVDNGVEIFVDAVGTPGTWRNLSEAAKQIRRDNAWSLIGLVKDAQEPFDCADANKITAPVLLVTGDKSPRLYAMMHAALQACLKQSQMVTILNASHPMNRENPDAFNTVVLQFLANMSSTNRPTAHQRAI